MLSSEAAPARRPCRKHRRASMHAPEIAPSRPPSGGAGPLGADQKQYVPVPRRAPSMARGKSLLDPATLNRFERAQRTNRHRLISLAHQHEPRKRTTAQSAASVTNTHPYPMLNTHRTRAETNPIARNSARLARNAIPHQKRSRTPKEGAQSIG